MDMFDAKQFVTPETRPGEWEWYLIDTAAAYNATINWLDENHAVLRALLTQPDGQLVDAALGGDELARFVLKARQPVAEITAAFVTDNLDLARMSREETPNELVDIRADVLNRVRRFYTEVLHQQAGVSIGLHWDNAPHFRMR